MVEGRYAFRALIYPSDDKYEAHIPALDATTFGADMQDVVYMAQDLIENIVAYYVDEGIEVPQEDLSDGVGREMPDGECVAVLFTDGAVAEIEDMSVQDAAGILGTTANGIHALCERGKLRSHKVGDTVLVYTDSVRERQNASVRGGYSQKRAAMAK